MSKVLDELQERRGCRFGP